MSALVMTPMIMHDFDVLGDILIKDGMVYWGGKLLQLGIWIDSALLEYYPALLSTFMFILTVRLVSQKRMGH